MTSTKPPSPEKTQDQTNETALGKFLPQLGSFSAALLFLSEEGNDRLTINQAAFFVLAGAADARGRPMTLSEIMERGDGILNKSLVNTYRVLLDPVTKDYKNIGLGWLVREPDANDERRKFLRLTPKGRRVLKAALLALGHNAYRDDDSNGGTT